MVIKCAAGVALKVDTTVGFLVKRLFFDQVMSLPQRICSIACRNTTTHPTSLWQAQRSI